MADAAHYRQVRSIVQADPERRVVVVSAAGKRSSDDTKITDPKSVIYPEAETILRKGKKVFHKVVVEE